MLHILGGMDFSEMITYSYLPSAKQRNRQCSRETFIVYSVAHHVLCLGRSRSTGKYLTHVKQPVPYPVATWGSDTQLNRR